MDIGGKEHWNLLEILKYIWI